MHQRRSLPLWPVIVGSLLVMYLAFYVRPVFLNPAQTMFFPRYVPSMEPIGYDLLTALVQATDLKRELTPYRHEYGPEGFYPPLGYAAFCPLTAIPFPAAYRFITTLTIAAFVSVMLLLPLAAGGWRNTTALVGLILAGFMSYGVQLEIERGQFNVFAITCCAWGLFLFHRGNGKWARGAAYLLFSAAVQLKLYPAVFVFGLTRNARDWRNNIVRWIGVGLANVACLFVFGPSVFKDFLDAYHLWTKRFPVHFGNHSLQGFTALLSGTRLGPSAGVIAAACTGLFIAAFALTLVLGWRRNNRSAFKYVMALCALASMLLPALSYDYKLPVFTVAFSFFVSQSDRLKLDGVRGRLQALLFSLLSLAYAWTLFPPVFKPALLQARNSAPALLASAVLLLLMMLNETGQDAPPPIADTC